MYKYAVIKDNTKVRFCDNAGTTMDLWGYRYYNKMA